MSYKLILLPLLLDDCMDAGGRATHGAVAERVGERRIKSTSYISPSSQPSPSREKEQVLV